MDAVDRFVAQWRALKPELDTQTMALVARLGRIAAIGERHIAQGLARHGLKIGEFDVLATLRRAGEPLTPTDMYRTLMLTSGAMTHRLARLEEQGLVSRKVDAQDQRGYRITLTKKGRELVDTAVEAHVENEAEMLNGLDAKERAALNTLLSKLLVSLGG